MTRTASKPDHEARAQLQARARRANQSTVLRWLARAGLVANGLVNLLIGVLAFFVAIGLNAQADQSGALTAIASTPGGVVLLWLSAIGLFGLALWQWTDAAWVTAPRARTVLMRRLTDVFKAFGFAAIGVITLIFALGGRSNGGAAQAFSAFLVRSPGGIVILVVAGAVVGSVGVAHLVRGVTRRFREEVSPPPGAWSAVVTTFGVLGHLGKAAALVIIGALAISAAIAAKPLQATGLDGALKYLVTLPYGVFLLVAIAVGFVSYGLYLFARARYMRH
jgi:hypothetical protein